MKFIADLHIHSHYSLATSKELEPEHLDYWARLKGISLVATGDFTHPGWIKELKEKLEPAEEGLFKLKPELRLKLPLQNPEVENYDVRFILSSEISSIYKKDGKVRKVHNLLYAPDFETVEKIQHQLAHLNCNITSDGRPIVGIDSRDLLEIALNCSPDTFFVPAHIWTPWFSILGEKGGFNSVEECFGDLTPHIHALETGLSTDPALNWMCSFLDSYTLLSNSDAHSPDRLGRNSNIFNCDFDYNTIIEAIKKADGKSFIGTIDFFPQEGKYHYDGHRKCNVCWNPVETLRNRAICPVCGRRVVVGVASRIAQLSDRTDITQRPNRRDFYSIIPLPELLSEIAGTGESSKKVKQWYSILLQKFGSEFDILLNHPPEFFENNGEPVLAEAIRRMRNGNVIIKEGFDGEYGVIKVFQPGEAKLFEAGEKLFADTKVSSNVPKRKLLNFDLAEYQQLIKENYSFEAGNDEKDDNNTDWLSMFNAEQRQAVLHQSGPALVLAGPGTGKTRVLTSRIANLVNNSGVNPSSILAITFTNKASGEIKSRLEEHLKNNEANLLKVATFHSLGLDILRENIDITGRKEGFILVGDDEKTVLLKTAFGWKERDAGKLSENITSVKQNLKTAEEVKDEVLRDQFILYQNKLKEANAFDLDDLIYLPFLYLKEDKNLADKYKERYSNILIDEYQDINYAQYHFIRQILSETNGNIFAIGDPNQSIYGFRGSDIEFIRRFTLDFPSATVYQLKKSYRCTDRILLASTQVLNIKEDDPLKGTSRGLKIRIDTHVSDQAEASFIAKTIDELMGGMQFHSMDRGLQNDYDEELEGLSDFAILCRTRSQMEIIAQILAEKNIPVQVIGREAFYQFEPFKTVVNILSWLINPENELLRAILKDAGVNPDDFKGIRSNESLERVIKEVISKITILKEKQYQFQNDQLVSIAKRYSDLNSFINTCRLGSGTDTWQQKAGKVSLMTIHAAKGLEFGCVFIPGCEDGLIPYTLYRDDTDMDEEKRLLYVGMTRASKYLFLSHALVRKINNRELRLDRSPFLNNIENTLFEMSFREKKKEKVGDTQLKLF
jgi:uncharacterized protein (TIGR00375 family)